MTITITRSEARTILEEYMNANYAIGDQLISMRHPYSEISSTVLFDIVDPMSEEYLHNPEEAEDE